jgi:hypothetical protein
MLSPQAEATNANSTGKVRLKCRLMGGYGAIGQVRAAIKAGSGGKPAPWRRAKGVAELFVPHNACRWAVYLGNASLSV